MLARIAEINAALRLAHSEDVRATLQEALAECERVLRGLDGRPSAGSPSLDGG